MLLSTKRGDTIWECDWCKKSFKTETSRANEAIKKNQKKFCGERCRKEYQSKISSQRVANWIKENGHPRFNGGIGITTDGYVWIKYIGGHNNQVKLHRYLMEIKIGRPLLPKEIVHHIDKDKFNNRIENLQIVTKGEHNTIHFTKGR